MPNTAEYKDWLFVTVPEDATDFMLLTKAGERDFWRLPDDVMNRIDLYANGVYNTPVVWLNLFGSYQIIGKGDALGETDWHIMIDVIDGDEGFYPNFDHTNFREVTAIQSGHSLLRSLGMEPGTTLILKMNEK